MQTCRTLFIGDAERPEFSEAVRWLNEHTAWTLARDISSALRQLNGLSAEPHVLVVAQARPGQVSASDMEALQRAAPLARPIALLGSCCEGQLLGGQPWHGAMPIYWHQWVARCQSAWTAAGRSPRSSLALPRTATEVDRLLQAAQWPLPRGRGLVALCCRERESAAALADACTQAGYGTAWAAPGRVVSLTGIDLILWDGDLSQSGAFEALARIVREGASAPTLALLNFPRPEDVALAVRAGATAVLSKPFLLHDLLSRIDLALQPRDVRAPMDPAA